MVVWRPKGYIPRFFRIVHNQDASVADLLDSSSGSPRWNVHFTRSVHDWETDAISDMFRLLYATSIGLAEMDRMIWIHLELRSYLLDLCTRCCHVRTLYIFSLGVYMEEQGAIQGCILWLDCIPRENSDSG